MKRTLLLLLFLSTFWIYSQIHDYTFTKTTGYAERNSSLGAKASDTQVLDGNILKPTLALRNNQSRLPQFSFYPNPVKNVLNISYVGNILEVTVYNLLGKEIVSKTVNENFTKVDMSSLSRGTYIVKVTSDNQVKTIKVIKE